MTIHHATIKRAAGLGIVLTEDGEGAKAHHTERNRVVTIQPDYEDAALQEQADDEGNVSQTECAKQAIVCLTEIGTYEAEHAGIRVIQKDGDFIASKGKAELARDPILADLFETLSEGAEIEADDEDAPHSVVPEKYKKLYAERGDPNHCGDWLATTLATLCRVLNEKGREVTDIDRLETIARANGVDAGRYGKLGMETNGWQGRYRMTVRNLLTPLVAAKGNLFVPEGCGKDHDQELKAPREWCAAHASKARVKEAAKPTKGVVAKDPGQGKKNAKTLAKERGDAGLKAANEAIKASKARRLHHPQL